MTRLHLWAAVLAALFTACARAPGIEDSSFAITPLTLSAAEDSRMPQLTASADRAVVSWVDIDTEGTSGDSRATLRFAERSASGWTEPRTAASGTNWFLTAADVPSVARLDDGTIAAHWPEATDPENEAYDVRLVFSKDEGRTWTAPISPHHDGTKTQHGFASLFQMPGAGLGLVWLDGRQVDPKSGKDDMSVRAATFNRDGTQTSDTLVDARVCDCCPMSTAVTPDGPIVAFRDRSAGEIRDIAVSRFANGAWTTPRTVHDDGWEIRACPVNGPAISAHGRTVAIAWFTAKDDQGHAFAAFSQDAGATFAAPVRLDDVGSTGRVGVAVLDDGSAAATWVEVVDRQAKFQLRRVDASGRRSPAQTVATMSGGRSSVYPRLVRRGQELLLAWVGTENGRSGVKTAAASLP